MVARSAVRFNRDFRPGPGSRFVQLSEEPMPRGEQFLCDEKGAWQRR